MEINKKNLRGNIPRARVPNPLLNLIEGSLAGSDQLNKFSAQNTVSFAKFVLL